MKNERVTNGGRVKRESEGDRVGKTATHFVVEVNLDELSEATGVVVANRLRVSERLEQRVGCKKQSQI